MTLKKEDEVPLHIYLVKEKKDMYQWHSRSWYTYKQRCVYEFGADSPNCMLIVHINIFTSGWIQSWLESHSSSGKQREQVRDNL